MRYILVIAALLLLIHPTFSLHAHPYHTSIAEAEFNPKTRELEVSLQVSALALDALVRHLSGGQLKLDGDGAPTNTSQTHALDELIRKYVQKHFVVFHQPKHPLTLRWVGRESGVTLQWLHFALHAPRKHRHLYLINRVFFDAESSQRNTVSIQRGGVRRSITFDRHSKPARVQIR